MRTLRWFQQVADGMTLTDLSALEFTTQSGISRALARLDSEVGAALLQRTGRTLRPTLAGAAFKAHVDGAMHQLDDALAAVAQVADPDSGTVSVAFQPSLGSWLVPDLVRSFRQEHPHVRFRLVPKRQEHVSSVSRDGLVELELGTRRPTEPDLHWRQLVTESLLLAVPAGHPLGERAQVDLAECADEPFITIGPSSDLRTVTEELIGRAGADLDWAFSCDDLPTMRAFVAAGLGVAIMPRPHGAAATFRGLTYVRIDDPKAQREVGMTWAHHRRLLPATELFRTHVLQRRARGALPEALSAPSARGTAHGRQHEG